MAGRVLSAAVGSLLVLVALLLKCQCTCSGTISTNAAQVIPSSYEIHSAAVYVDPACYPPSSSERVTPKSVVLCFPKHASATPRLTDGVLGPDNLPSTTTDYAYTLAGPSQFGQFETWIQFDFTSRVSVASVTLHYYCTGQSPQLRLNDGSGVVAPPVSPQCDSTAQRQCLTINVSTSTSVVNLKVLRNNNTIYISEVKFFAEFSTPTTDSSTNVMDMPTATPSSNQHGPLSTDDITSTLPNSSQTTTMATPKTSPSGLQSNNSSAVAATTIPNSNRSNQPGPRRTDSTPVPNSSQTTPMATPETTSTNNETSSAVAGAVAGVVAGLVVCIVVAVLLIIACFIFKRRRNMKLKDDGQPSIDNPVYEAIAKDNASPEHILTNSLYEIGKGLKHEPTDDHLTAADAPCYEAVNNDSRGSRSTGHHASSAVYDKVKTSTDTYTVPLSPDTDTYSFPTSLARQPLAPKRTGLLGRSSHFGIQNSEINTASDRGHTYSSVGSEKSNATARAVYPVSTVRAVYDVATAVMDKKKEAPPPLPPPYQPRD